MLEAHARFSHVSALMSSAGAALYSVLAHHLRLQRHDAKVGHSELEELLGARAHVLEPARVQAKPRGILRG